MSDYWRAMIATLRMNTIDISNKTTPCNNVQSDNFRTNNASQSNAEITSTFNEVEYVGKRQIVKIEQLATKQDNNNLEHIFVAYILGREVLENSSGRTV